MRQALVLLCVAGVGALLYAATAPAGQQAVTPGQFNALKARVAKAEKRVANLETIVGGCFTTAIPISRYGGYVYVNPDGSTIITTALDVTGTGGQVGAYALDVGPACAQVINSAGYKKMKIARLAPVQR